MGRKNNKKLILSRKAKRFITAGVVVVVILLSVADRIFQKNYVEPTATKRTSSADVDKYHLKKFTVVKVVDGDTVDINIDDGKYPHTRIRLLGMDTPETKNPKTGLMYFGQEASDKTKELVLNEEVTVLIDTVSRSRDKYGRLLGYIKMDDGVILNEYLVANGYAYADVRFDHSFYKKYLSAQGKAKKQKLGLWGEVRFEDMPEWMQEKEERR